MPEVLTTPIAFDGSENVDGALVKMQEINDALLRRNLPDKVRLVLSNLGTCLSCYIYELRSTEPQT